MFGDKQDLSSPTKKKKSRQQRPPDSYRRPKPKEDEITDQQELALDSCPHCNGEVSGSQDTYKMWIEDIVFAPKTVTEYNIHRHFCRSCNKLVHAPVPNALPGMNLGMNIVIYILLEHYCAKKTDDEIIASLHRYHNLDISSGEITAIRHKAADFFGEKYNDIIETIRQAEVVYGDETGWKIRSKATAQCWILASPGDNTVRYIIADTRGAGVLEEALGLDFQGVMVSDFYRAYDGQGDDQQKCWIHLLREMHLLARSDPTNTERSLLNDQLLHEYQAIARFKKKDWRERSAKYTETMISHHLEELIHSNWQDKECRRIIDRITRCKSELLACVRHENVLPENNTAERGLRPVVVHRKITNDNRSDKGAKTYQVNKSVIETLRLENRSLIDTLRHTLYNSAWKISSN